MILPWLNYLLRPSDSSPEWSPPMPEPGDRTDAARECREADDLEDLDTPGHPPIEYPRVDLENAAASSRYTFGSRPLKRTRYPVVDLSTRLVIIVLHQMGVERRASSRRWPYVTAHRVIGPDGTRMKVHPLEVRLVAANRADRKPYHAISIEISGNFEGVDGDGKYFMPERMGRGRAGEAQIRAARQETFAITREVREMGGRVAVIAPHRIFGRDKKGKPNRPICCGSRVWSMVGEWAGAELDLAIPADGFALGGLPIEEDWHGFYRPACRKFWRGGTAIDAIA